MLMGENPVKKEPIKEEPKKNVLHLEINLDTLNDALKIETPANQSIWKDDTEMSEEYKLMLSTLCIIAKYIARVCNEGPEVKDNINKRLVTIKTIMDTFTNNLAINGYNLYGLLAENLHDAYMKISGTHQIISAVKKMQAKSERLSMEKSKIYTS